MKATERFNQVFFATIVFGLNGYFIANVCGNEDMPDSPDLAELPDDIHIMTDDDHELMNFPQMRDDYTLHDTDEMSEVNYIQDKDLPKFAERLQNITITVGRDALLVCVVDNLQTYKIAWLRVDTQTILTIQTHVITKNHRMIVTHAENRAWTLKIRDVRESDKGLYMCQVNTDPMKSQMAYLDVVVPPDILDYPTSTDMVVKEGSNVTLRCQATGSPPPTITFRREDGEPIMLAGGLEVTSINGSNFSIARVDRLHMGAYLCIASNGIPPTVSKRVMLIVHFPPMMMIQNQLVGAAIGQPTTLECSLEAFPRSINYWKSKNGSIIAADGRFKPDSFDNAYKTVMTLTILSVEIGDFGQYKCVAKNSLGETDGNIKLYHIPRSTMISTMAPPTTTPLATATTASTRHGPDIYKEINRKTSEKKPPHKSNIIDMFAMATNNVLPGAVPGREWNSDSRDRGHQYTTKSHRDVIPPPRPSSEAEREADSLTENEASKASLANRCQTICIWTGIYSLFLIRFQFLV